MKYSIYFWAEVLAFITSLAVYKNIRNSHLRYFGAFLGGIVLFEFGVIQNWLTVRHSNLWAVNFISAFQFVFYAFYLRSIVRDGEKKKRILMGLVITLLLTLINISFLQGFWRLHSYTLLIFSVMIVYWVCLFFRELLDTDNDQLSLLKHSNFWIATGLLFFYLAGFTFFSFFEYMAYINDYEYLWLTKLVLTFSNFILYSFIAIGLICQQKTHPS
jgi:hypothetical protein